MWKSVNAEDVKCRIGWGREWVGVLSPLDASENSVILKFGDKYTAVALKAHQVLSEARVAPLLLVH